MFGPNAQREFRFVSKGFRVAQAVLSVFFVHRLPFTVQDVVVMDQSERGGSLASIVRPKDTVRDVGALNVNTHENQGNHQQLMGAHTWWESSVT